MPVSRCLWRDSGDFVRGVLPNLSPNSLHPIVPAMQEEKPAPPHCTMADPGSFGSSSGCLGHSCPLPFPKLSFRAWLLWSPLWILPSCGMSPNFWLRDESGDKKGLSGKQNNFERKAVYQRQVRAPSLLAKSILEGYRPIPADTYVGGSLPLPPPVSDRMRKRRAFADKELENIMLEREYKEREMLEASQAAALFLPNRMVHGPEYNSYKSAYSPTPVEPPNKDFCNLLPTCLDLTMQYSGSGNMELISSNVSVATTYRQYPFSSRFLVWPKCGPISDTLLYQQCLLNTTTSVQALKPGASWDLKGVRVQEGLVAEHDIMPPKLEALLVLPQAPEVQTSRSDLQGHQAIPERSAFSPPRRNFSTVDTDPLAAQGHILTRISKESTRHPLPLKHNPFHSLFQQTLNDKSGPELKTPFVKEAFEEAPKKHRECLVKENQKYTFTIDRYAKDLFVAKQVGTKLSVNEPLSFSVESILKRPSSAITHVSQ
uniref:doublesex- and mab-3-related transcription factor 2 isoform X1 n=1 Tax=Nyctereutes procyonoides TaxID=34880 RepID=UPI002443A575|nr:doublesex- and mab-3-related transcription factor 2 isoform X1 [Nyctereutes procyonoides]